MQNLLICHGYAHRLLKNGLIESTPVKKQASTTVIDDSDWKIRQHREMDMSGGDISEVKMQLTRLNAIFYSNETRMPSAEPLKPVVRESVVPVTQ